ncbi:polysaccharide deacetylase family protein [Desertivirga brevis]|uniref:polysaccharide deacetylase family protein n=1 Tax=Desertivirga brevis TaxID=2810310 RepID=UPI001A964C03|nr:polysaccharide deacetylase family protein [Pedobacter sp. SYSU D00873]
MYLIKTPFWLRWLYPGFVWRKPLTSRTVYLTFDDGPIPDVTPFVLDTLTTFNAKATFFCIGDNIRKHPDIFRRIVDEGHSIGNHTYNHLKGWDTEDDIYLQNFNQCQQLTDSNLFRPPYGRVKRSQASKLKKDLPDLKIIMWDVLSGDFDQDLSPEKCLRNVVNNVSPGSIIVFHDSLKAYDRLKYALPGTLDFCLKHGLSFGVL